MILITPELFADFQATIREGFIQRKLNAYAENDPAAYDVIGEKYYRQYVESAIEMGEFYGLDSEDDINTILYLMDHLGWDFSRDPLLNWARLAEKETPSQARQRLRRMKEIVESFDVDGQAGQSFEAALRRFMLLDLREFPDTDTGEEIARRLKALYPEKFACLSGVDFAKDFLITTRTKAAYMGMFYPAGRFLIAYAMFMLGSSFESDPRYIATLDPNKFYPPPEKALLATLRNIFAARLENMERQKRL